MDEKETNERLAKFINQTEQTLRMLEHEYLKTMSHLTAAVRELNDMPCCTSTMKKSRKELLAALEGYTHQASMIVRDIVRNTKKAKELTIAGTPWEIAQGSSFAKWEVCEVEQKQDKEN